MGTANDFLEKHPELLDADLTSERALRWTSRLAAPLAAYFRFTLSGAESVPGEPCVIVANHSIGSPFVLLLLARAWTKQFGTRPVRGLMHRVAWQPPFRQLGLLQKLGGVYAHPLVAERSLRSGKSLLVFPGGDVEAMRPFRDRYRVDFAGRTGFVRLARVAGAKIVPLVICGSHATYFSLPGAERIAKLVALDRWTGLKRFPLTLGGVVATATLAVPPLWPYAPVATAFAAVPMPTRIEARFLPPLVVERDEPDAAAAERVRLTLEEELARMGRERATFLA